VKLRASAFKKSLVLKEECVVADFSDACSSRQLTLAQLWPCFG
jgi:hypothetical protein